MCDSSIGSVQFAALIDTLPVFLFSIAVMIKIECEKQILRFAQDDNYFCRSRRGGNPAKQKRFSRNVSEVKHFVLMALDSRLRGNDGHVGNRSQDGA